jgi:hypothetical protein
MTATTFCDSPAVAMLVRTHNRAAETNAELRLVTHARAVLRALQTFACRAQVAGRGDTGRGMTLAEGIFGILGNLARQPLRRG